MSERTKGPWELTGQYAKAAHHMCNCGLDERLSVLIVGTRTGGDIALINNTFPKEQQEANAKFIVRACNSFDALLAACEGAAMNCESMRMECADPLAGELADTAQELRQAIAKARGE